MSSWMPSAKNAFSFSSLMFSNGSTAMLFAAPRELGPRKRSIKSSATARVRTAMITKSIFRPNARVPEVSGGASSVLTIPSAVTSNIHAHAIAIGKPASSTTMMVRTIQPGASKNGSVCVVTWIKSHAIAA